MVRIALVVLAALLSTQVLAAGCVGLPKAQKDACLQRIIDNLPPVNYEQVALDNARADAFMQRAANERLVEKQQRGRAAQIAAQLQAQEQARIQQQQAAAEQARRDAVAEATLQQLRYNAQQQEIANQQAQQAPKPAARRPMNCYTYGGGYMHCD